MIANLLKFENNFLFTLDYVVCLKLIFKILIFIVLETVTSSNLHAAPGTDGLPGLLYKECWSCLGPALSDVMRGVFSGQKLTKSMRTSLMVFGSKPKKQKKDFFTQF